MRNRIRGQYSINHLLLLILWMLLTINIASLILYQFTNVGNDFYHEAAYPYLYAKTNVDTNTLYSSHFSGREIAPISWPLVNQVLIMLGFKLNFLTVAISNTLFLIFAMGVVIWFGKAFEIKRIYVLLVLVLFTTPFGSRPFKYGWFDQVWIWPMNSYGIYEVLSLVLCIISYKIIKVDGHESSFIGFIHQNKFKLLPFFLFGMNHSRGLFEIYGPVFFALVMLTLFDLVRAQRLTKVRYSNLLFASLIYTILGRIFIEIFSHGVPQVTQAPSQTFTSLDASNLIPKVFSPILTVLQVFGVNPVSGVSVFSPHGLRIMTLFGLVIAVVFVPIIFYIKSSNFLKLDLGGKFMFLHLLYFVFISVITSIFTSSAGQVRYSIPLAISAIYFVPFLLSHSDIRQKILLFLLISLIVPSVGNGVQKLNLNPGVSYKESSNYKLTQSLLERELSFGFAGPWIDDVLAIPFYSGGEINVGVIEPDSLRPHGHANKSWFLERYHQGQTFIAIPTTFIPISPRFSDFLRESKEMYVVDKWTVLVFKDNPARKIGQLN